MPNTDFPRPWSRRGRARRSCALLPALRAAGPLALSLVAACGTEGYDPPPPPEPDALYWRLALDHHAVTLALRSHDTLPLAAVPLTPAGKVLAGLPAPTYVSRNTAKVVVTPDGVVRAVGAVADPVLVVATLTTADVTHADSVWVRVLDVDDPPVLATLSVQPVPPDSAKIAMGVAYMPPLPVRAADDGGNPLTDVMVAFRSSDQHVASIDQRTGLINPIWPGRVTFHASATMFGVSKADSVEYRVGAPIDDAIFFQPTAPGGGGAPDFSTRTIGVGGLVLWWIQSQDEPHGFDLEFDDEDLAGVAPMAAFSERARLGLLDLFCTNMGADCGGGNATVIPPAVQAIRVFTAPGVYDYRCTSCGRAGRIVVVDER